MPTAAPLIAQIIGPIVNVVFIFGASWAFFKILDAVMGMRVSPEVELLGLDVPEMGVHGYPEVQGPTTSAHGTPSSKGALAGATSQRRRDLDFREATCGAPIRLQQPADGHRSWLSDVPLHQRAGVKIARQKRSSRSSRTASDSARPLL